MLVSLSKINKSFGERTLFDDVSFSVDENDKIGLVGSNGSGKTTLFNIILEKESAKGDIFKSKDLRIGCLEQQINIESSNTVLGEVMTVYEKLIDAETELSEIADKIEKNPENINSLLKRQQHLREFYEKEGGYTYKSIAHSSLLGLGFSENDLEKPFNTLSGGQKTRVLLCKTLLSDCNLLMLDEPTNHLDLESAAWLEGFLRERRGACIVVSHDRYFLDRVTDRTFEIANNTLTVYEGNYTRHLEIRAEREKVLKRQYENTQKEIARLNAVIEEQRRWNKEKSVKRAESKQKVVDKLTDSLVAPPSEEKTLHFEFSLSKSSGNDVLICKDLTMAFGEKQLFKNANIHIRRGEKVFLVGANGCGKTTLFKIILNLTKPICGEVSLGANVEVGYYDQAQDNLSLDKTIFDEISDAYPNLTQTEIRNGLAAFLFTGDDVFKTIDTLSGGERARVLILKLMLSGANFLLLDEPTNHLDIASREALEKSILNYGGTILAVSHDRYFINKLTDRVLHMTKDGITSYLGDYDYFCEKRTDEAIQKEKTEEKSHGALSYKAEKERQSTLRRLNNLLKKTEDEIAQLEEEVEALTKALSLPENASDYVKLDALSKNAEQKNEKIMQLYELWEKTEEEKNDLEQ